MDIEERAKEIARLPDYGILALADYIESEIAKAEIKKSKTCWRCGKQLSGAHTCIPRPELREEIKKAEKKGMLTVYKDIHKKSTGVEFNQWPDFQVYCYNKIEDLEQNKGDE